MNSPRKRKQRGGRGCGITIYAPPSTIKVPAAPAPEETQTLFPFFTERHAEWLLERQFPHEFASYDRRPVPREPVPVPDLSGRVRFTCHGAPDVDLGLFMEWKAKLEAAGAKTDFPVRDGNNEMPNHQTEQPVEPIDNGKEV